MTKSIYANPELLATAKAMGEVFARSGLFGCRNVEQGVVFAIEMITSNRTPFAMMQTYHVISDNVTKKASAQLAEFNARGGKHKIRRFTPEVVHVEFQWEGETVPVELTWEMAQAENWPWVVDRKTNQKRLSRNWSTPLQRASMLMARAITRGLRAICPEINAGTYAPEEMEFATEDLPQDMLSSFGPREVEKRVGDRYGESVNDPCDQIAIDRIRHLGQQIYEVDTTILADTNEQLRQFGKTEIASLTIKEAQHLQGWLENRLGAVYIDKGIVGKESVPSGGP